MPFPNIVLPCGQCLKTHDPCATCGLQYSTECGQTQNRKLKALKGFCNLFIRLFIVL